MNMQIVRLVLSDQLNSQHSWFRECDPAVVYVFMELRPATNGVKHHIQKLIGHFAAMRAFAARLQQNGHQVTY
ncbi:MAG: cryptochrome/photolyase family protein, partial [Bacteroidota bacterium]